MRLVFIHGPAAAGKYTVAKELAALTGFELYHNHLVVDEVLKVHAFGRRASWRSATGAGGNFSAQFPGPGPADIIFTFNPENTVHRPSSTGSSPKCHAEAGSCSRSS